MATYIQNTKDGALVTWWRTKSIKEHSYTPSEEHQTPSVLAVLFKTQHISESNWSEMTGAARRRRQRQIQSSTEKYGNL